MDMEDVQKRLEAKRKRQYYDAYRKYWIAHDLCWHCGREKLDPRYKTCERCRKKSTEYNMKYKEVNGMSRKEYIREYSQKRRERLIAAGLCYVCGKEPPMNGRRWCAKCAADALERQRRRKNESSHQQTNVADAKSN